MKRRTLLLGPLLGLLPAGCAGDAAPVYPAAAAGSYQLDYAGVYGTGRIVLALKDGKVSGLNTEGAGPSYRGFYRQAADRRRVAVDLIVHLPPTRQVVQGVAVTGTARDVLIRFAFPADLGPGTRWPVEIGTQAGPITGEIARLP